MGLKICTNCQKINKTMREDCWYCHSKLELRNPIESQWAEGSFAYRKNPNKENSNDIHNSSQIISTKKNTKLIKKSEIDLLKSNMRMKKRNPLLDPNLGPNIAKEIFFKNPKGESKMRRLKRFNRNPQKPVWGENLFGGGRGVWGNTLYKRRKLQRRNPQAPVWGDNLYNTGQGAWGKTLFRNHRRNPQAPVWGDNLYNTGQGAWGKTLFKNPQAPVWGDNLYNTGQGAWGKTLFRNPQAPVWGDNLYTGQGAWGKTLFRKNPNEGLFKSIFSRRNPDEDWRENPQAPVWGDNLYNTGQGAWGKTLFKRNPHHLEDSMSTDDDLDEEWDDENIDNDDVMDENDWRCNPDEDEFEEDVEIEEEPLYRRKNFRRYRRN